MTTKTVRNARKLERPRPLRTSQTLDFLTMKSGSFAKPTTGLESVESVLQDLESLHININNGNYDDSTTVLLVQVCSQLKNRGQQLDQMYKENLDRYFVTLRNASRDERLDIHCRLRLLEIVELRAAKWKTNENLTNYYKYKLQEMENSGYMSTLSHSATVPYIVPSMLQQSPSEAAVFPLSQGEVLRSSGKFTKPTKIPGKNFFKDEIIIRNSDSGKVSPGARDRLVQITGPNDESISQAKVLIDDTIRRNASPVREKAEIGAFGVMGSESSTSLNSSVSEDSNGLQTSTMGKKPLMHSYSMGDATLGEYTYSVCVGSDSIRISGTKVDLVQTAKLVLEEYFAAQAEMTDKLLQQQSVTAANSFWNQEAEAFSAAKKPHSYGLSRQDSAKLDGVPGEKVDRWLMRSNSVGGTGNRNGPLRSSSSEEETYKGEGSLTEDDKAAIYYNSPITSPVIKKSTLFFQPNQGNTFVTTETIERLAHTERKYSLQRSFSESQEKIRYTRDVLLECALLPQSRVRPKDDDMLSAEAAALIRERPNTFFVPFIYKEQWKAQMERKDGFRASPPQSQEN